MTGHVPLLSRKVLYIELQKNVKSHGWLIFLQSEPVVSIAFGLVLIAAVSPGSLLDRLRWKPVSIVAAYTNAIYLSHKMMITLTSYHVMDNPVSVPVLEPNVSVSIPKRWSMLT